MNNNLEPGDLALVIKSLDGHTTGKVVECIQIDFVDHPEHGTIWLVKSSREDLISEYGGISDTIHVPRKWLMKIPKDPLPDEDEDLEIHREDLIDA